MLVLFIPDLIYSFFTIYEVVDELFLLKMEELNPNPGSYGGTSVSPSEGTSGGRSEIPPRNISEIPPDG
jgi:hypothetical protein